MAPSRTYFFYGLNAVRFLSVVGLLLVFASSILVMVNNIKAVNNFQAAKTTNTTDDASMLDCDYIQGSTVPNQAAGVFWAVVSSLLILFQTIVLILSECGWPASFFDRFFPVLGSDFGLGALGIFQCLIGAQILSHHVDEFSLVAAFFLFSIGCLNMLLGLIFRESAKTKRGIAAYRDACKNVLPIATLDKRAIFINASPAFATPSDTSSEKSGYGFGRQGEKAAGLRGFMLQKPEESLPRYASPSPSPSSRPLTPVSRPASPVARPSRPVTPPRAPLQRFKSIRTSTSSFVSPGAYRQETRTHDISDDEDDIYDDRSETPPPTFRSSPTPF
ncbi:hypothetical protein C8J56DRAFT_856795 [Mycena floridula]|nr:hypothetical protein C8J56DRAFT_856795 [Mycena floridula]